MDKIWLLFLVICNLIDYGLNNVLLKKYENCEGNINYLVKYNLTIRTRNAKQYLDGTVIIEKDFDDTLRSNVSVDIMTGNKYVYLFSINERKSCSGMHKFFGEFMYEIERNMRLIPGMCPIPKGKYQLHNLEMHFEKITTLVNFPFGSIRLTDFVYDGNDNIYSCVLIEAVHNF